MAHRDSPVSEIDFNPGGDGTGSLPDTVPVDSDVSPPCLSPRPVSDGSAGESVTADVLRKMQEKIDQLERQVQERSACGCQQKPSCQSASDERPHNVSVKPPVKRRRRVATVRRQPGRDSPGSSSSDSDEGRLRGYQAGSSDRGRNARRSQDRSPYFERSHSPAGNTQMQVPCSNTSWHTTGQHPGSYGADLPNHLPTINTQAQLVRPRTTRHTPGQHPRSYGAELPNYSQAINTQEQDVRPRTLRCTARQHSRPNGGDSPSDTESNFSANSGNEDPRGWGTGNLGLEQDRYRGDSPRAFQPPTPTRLPSNQLNSRHHNAFQNPNSSLGVQPAFRPPLRRQDRIRYEDECSGDDPEIARYMTGHSQGTNRNQNNSQGRGAARLPPGDNLNGQWINPPSVTRYGGNELHRQSPPPMSDSTTYAVLSRENRGDNSEKPKRKPVWPDKFNGTTSSLQDFLAHFEVVSKINMWTEEEKGSHLCISLKGNAQKVITSLGSDQRENYKALVAALEERFGTEGQDEIFKAQLQSYSKSEKESYQDLADNISKLVSKAYPSASHSTVLDLTKDKFIDAIMDKEVRMRVKLLKPRSVREAVLAAIETDAITATEHQRGGTKRHVRKVNIDSKDDKAQAPSSPKNQRKKFNNRGKGRYGNRNKGNTNQVSSAPGKQNSNNKNLESVMGEMLNTLKAFMGEQQPDKAHSREDNSQQRGRGNRPRVPIQEVECYRCHEKGHYAKSCQADHNTLPKQQQQPAWNNNSAAAQRPQQENDQRLA